MIRLNIFCEGQTEQEFCRLVLMPHFCSTGTVYIDPIAVGRKKHRHLYGLGKRKKYFGTNGVSEFIKNTIKEREHPNVYFTTFFDLYALPLDFPGSIANQRNAADPTPFAIALEKAFADEINYHRFIPNLILHEFETLLFADPEAFRYSFDPCDAEIERLREIIRQHPSIEHINDGQATAPSKRIIEIFGEEFRGQKALLGPEIAGMIGLPKIRQACPHFDKWLSTLEAIAWQNP
jgi:hypothetical protein